MGLRARRRWRGSAVTAVSVNDLRVATAQLGRPPRGLDAIATRCPYGYPQVLTVHPVVDGAPFPTTFWLSCPHLVRAVDRLEADGWIALFEQRIANDPGFAEAYMAAHRRAVASRDERLGAADRRRLAASGQLEALLMRGIGGITDRARVKCLHLHVAQALVDSDEGLTANPIGDAVLARLRSPACPPQEVICSAFEKAEQIGQPSS